MYHHKSTQLLSIVTLILLTSCNLDISDPNRTVEESTPATSENKILDQDTSFFCDQEAENPTVKARSDLGNVPMITFKNDMGGLPAAQRCVQIASRLKKFHQEQKLTYLTWERIPNKGGRVINVAKREGDLYRSPEFVDLLLTLNPDDKVHKILDSLHGILSSAGGEPITN